MLISELITDVTDTLEDPSFTRWTQAELIRYINRGIKYIYGETLAHKEVEVIAIDALTQDYTLSFTPIDIESVMCDLPFSMTNTTTFHIAEPVDGKELTVEYYCVPLAPITATTESIDQTNSFTEALTDYVLYKCFAKETDPKYFAKAAFHEGLVAETLATGTFSYAEVGQLDLSRKEFSE